MTLALKPHPLLPTDKLSRCLAVAAILLAPFILGTISLWLGEDAGWDLRNYHIYNPFALLNHREGFDFLPSQGTYFYNPTLDVPFYLLAKYLPARGVGFILGAFESLNFIILFLIALETVGFHRTPRLRFMLCLTASALGCLGGGSLGEVGTAYNDNNVSIGIFLSVLFLIRQMRVEDLSVSPRASLRMMLCGIPAGAAMGLKLTAVTYCVALCLSFLFLQRPWKQKLALSFAFGVGITVGLLATYGDWGYFLGTHYGNPFFPYLGSLFPTPMAPTGDGRDIQFLPHSIFEYFAYPFIFSRNTQRVGEVWFRDYHILALYVLIPSVVTSTFVVRLRQQKTPTLRSRSSESTIFLIWFGIFSYFLWLIIFSIYRYILAIEMLAPVLIVLLIEQLPTATWKKVTFLFLVGLSFVATEHRANWTRLPNWDDHVIEATVPEIPTSSGLMILMAGTQAFSDVVPLFPPDIPFVRFSSFDTLREEAGQHRLDIETEALKRIEAHSGPLEILFYPSEKDFVMRGMNRFGLRFSAANCISIRDHLNMDEQLSLCPVSRDKAP